MTDAGRRKSPTRRGQATAQRILAAASELFLARGYEAVGVEDIVRRADCSKSSLYNLFAGKKQLLVAVVAELSDQFVGKLATLDVSRMGVEEGLRAFGRRLLQILLDERHLAFYRLTIAQAGRMPEVGREWQRHGPDAVIHSIVQFIIRHQEAGGLARDFDARMAAQQLHDLMAFCLVHRAVLGNRASRREVLKTIDDAVELFMRGYGAPKRSGKPGRPAGRARGGRS